VLKLEPPPAVELTVTCPNPFIGDSVIFGPANSCVTPPFKAYDAVVALFAQEAVPNKLPVILPDTLNDPVIWKVLPDANTKLPLLPPEVPLPTIKADCAVDIWLYWP